MGIADTIKGWFSSGKNAAPSRNSDISDTMKPSMDTAKDNPAPVMDKINDGSDATGRTMDGMTGGVMDNGTDAANDTINRMGKQNP